MSLNLLTLSMKMSNNVIIMKLEKTEMEQNKHMPIFIVHCCHINSIELAR